MTEATTQARAPTFLEELMSATPGESHLDACIQCGTCGGSCPSASAMDYTPRDIFAMVRAGMREEVLSSNTPWMCVSCYFCTVRCPQDILITDLMYTLKNMSMEANMYNPVAADFSKTFIWMVENFGRSFEVGLAGIHNIRHFATRMPKITPMAIGFFTKKGMSITPPKRIQGMKQLKDILKRAKELEAA